MAICAGELVDCVTIDRKIDTPTGTGAVVVTWERFAHQRVKMMALSGREYLAAQQVQSKLMAKAKVRAPTRIEPRMRLTYKGTVYNIEAVLPGYGTNRDSAILMLSAGVNDG